MKSSPKEIAARWKEQMKKGYLKMTILFVLMRKPMHGYEIMKEIGKLTLGVITPTAGSVYPTLKNLEYKGLIKDMWISEGRRIYRITSIGRDVFKEAVKKHFELTFSIRRWLLKEIAQLGIIEETDLPHITESAVAVLLNEETSIEKRIETLQRLRGDLQKVVTILSKMVGQMEIREEELRQKAKKAYMHV